MFQYFPTRRMFGMISTHSFHQHALHRLQYIIGTSGSFLMVTFNRVGSWMAALIQLHLRIFLQATTIRRRLEYHAHLGQSVQTEFMLCTSSSKPLLSAYHNCRILPYTLRVFCIASNHVWAWMDLEVGVMTPTSVGEVVTRLVECGGLLLEADPCQWSCRATGRLRSD